MTERQQLAEHGTGLCVAGLAAMGINAAAVIPLAVLAAWGVDRYKSCGLRKQHAALDRVLRQIETANPDHRSVGPALALLRENRDRVAITPSLLAEADARGDFPAALYDMVFRGVEVPKDDGVEALLRMILTAAWQDLRKEDDYHKIFVQESVTALERDVADGFKRIDAQLDRMESKLDALPAQLVAALRAEQGQPTAVLSPFAQTLLANEQFIVALAYRYAEGNPSDFDAALRGLERALEVAAEQKQRGQLPGNTDDAVNVVIARVDALNDAGDLDTAAALIVEEEARAEAGLTRLYDKGIAQAILTRDAGAACAYELKKLPLDVPDPAAQFGALRDVQDIWYARGRDKGLNFDLEVAIALARARHGRAGDADERGWALNDLGVVLGNLGKREAGTARLEQAVACYRAALEVWTQDRVPLDWARTQMNLGNALARLGEREADGTRLEQAVAVHRAALKERMRERVRLDWAMTQMNLGVALQTLGAREADSALLEQAVAAYRAALEEHTHKSVPLYWAATQTNLGNALSTLGEREAGTARLEEAVAAYRAALEERTRERVPLQWAMTQMGLGNVLKTLGEREAGIARLEQAAAAYRAALEEHTRERVPLDWAMAQVGLGTALQALGEREAGTARLEEAAAAYRAALEEYTRARVPLNWAIVQGNLCSLDGAFFDKTGDAAHLDAAQGHLDAAREVFAKADAGHYLAQTATQQSKIYARRAG
jgi:tetratricopeptide (TPR) repeat protein